MIALSFLLAVCLSLVSGRDYRLRASPSVSHSIVNLGKMEFNVYLNSKLPVPTQEPPIGYELIHDSKPLHTLRPESAECPCQQNRFKNRNLDHSPPDLLSKILMNNDLFSFKDSTSSPLCCSSHEQVQEEFYMEVHPKPAPLPMLRQNIPYGAPLIQSFPPMPMLPMDKAFPKPMQFLPLIFDTLSSNKGPLRQKPKTLEIILFPTRKSFVTAKVPAKQTPLTTPEPDIQAVGDKKTTMVYDLIAANSSVKKDLKQEVGEHLKNMDAGVETEKTTSSVQSNTL